MVVVAQLVRAPDCGSGGRRFEPGLPPKKGCFVFETAFFYAYDPACPFGPARRSFLNHCRQLKPLFNCLRPYRAWVFILH
jgi:hypothetical protein